MSLKIVHTFGRNAGLVQTIQKDVVRIGRAPEGDVVFDADYDRDASASHAEVRREGGRYVLLDLNSRNGTYVGGQRVQRHVLSGGEEVMFGSKGPRVRIELVAGGGDSAAAAPQGVPVKRAPATAREPAPAAGPRVGQRTIAMLISNAVASARGRGPQDTQALAAYVDKQVGAATAGHRRTTTCLGVLLVLSLAVLAGLLIWSRSSSNEIDRLRQKLADLPPNDPRRKDIEGRLGSLHPPNAGFGRTLYDQNKKGIFMLAAGGRGFCTAFAVKPSVLATNAHCVLSARKHGGNVVALENEGHGGASFPVANMRAHPAYRDNDAHALTPDVGIINISGRAATVLQMANAQELTAMGAGDEVYLIGFPGRLMDTSKPAATFLAAHIGRVTNSVGRPAPHANAWLIQHDASTTHGTSGSPIFNGKGKVIAVNAGSYLEGDEETVAGRKTEVVKASPYKFAMRIDLLNAVLR